GWHRRPPRPRREEISEQLVREQLPTVAGEESRHRVRGDQMTAEGDGVEELSVGVAGTLHPTIDSHRASVWGGLAQQFPRPTGSARGPARPGTAPPGPVTRRLARPRSPWRRRGAGR